MADDLARLDLWFGQIMEALSPSQRRRAALKLGQALRKSNLKRIAANVEPDGSKMAQKKARYDRRKRLVEPAGGKMFQGLRYAKQWRINPLDDGVEIVPANNLAGRTGEINQFGETVTVGRLRDGRRIRAKYAERILLGFSDADEKLSLDVAVNLVAPSG
jgi:phage virion morphogenesis protein